MYKFLLPSWALFVCAQFKKSLPTKDHEDVLLRFKKKKKKPSSLPFAFRLQAIRSQFTVHSMI